MSWPAGLGPVTAAAAARRRKWVLPPYEDASVSDQSITRDCEPSSDCYVSLELGVKKLKSRTGTQLVSAPGGKGTLCRRRRRRAGPVWPDGDFRRSLSAGRTVRDGGADGDARRPAGRLNGPRGSQAPAAGRHAARTWM